jgi:hypothetical protein
MLREVYGRYQRPLFVAETGDEDRRRAPWFRHVCREVHGAILSAIPVEGICLYPIMNHPGWVDDRHCYNGLWDYPDEGGHRKIFEPLAVEIRRARKAFQKEIIPWPAPARVAKENDRIGKAELMRAG